MRGKGVRAFMQGIGVRVDFVVSAGKEGVKGKADGTEFGKCGQGQFAGGWWSAASVALYLANAAARRPSVGWSLARNARR
jgi:hypothetical protein